MHGYDRDDVLHAYAPRHAELPLPYGCAHVHDDAHALLHLRGDAHGNASLPHGDVHAHCIHHDDAHVYEHLLLPHR